jgi:hypothetical protein
MNTSVVIPTHDKREKTEIPREVREFIRCELVAMAEMLRKREGYSIPQIRRIIKELLAVSV